MLKRNISKKTLKGSIIELFQTDIIHEILERYNCSGKCLLILDERSSLKNKIFIYKLVNYVNNEKVKSIFYKNNIF